MIRLRDLMTRSSRAKYLLWRTGLLGDAVAVRFLGGEAIVLERSLFHGLGTAYEIFVSNVYRSPRSIDRDSVKRIVDVGANVGFTVAYLAARYPGARIDAFEPHPKHLATLRRTISLNRLDDRVFVHPAAAGVSDGSSKLLSAGVCSTIDAQEKQREVASGLEAIEVPVVDFFSAIGSSPIDLLKIDCEGAEYDLLMDRRFAEIDARAIVMEWHATSSHPEAKHELAERLRSLNWDICEIPGETLSPIDELGILRAGIFWAYRQTPPRASVSHPRSSSA